ncbi:MAG: peptide-methionine (S)-S-oxide reductase MsrA, partial [Pseudomonadales bacterium]|nr:peptide-methionine (S)-S-oxide reductase MsrA [Pseudomonadales bacterium]
MKIESAVFGGGCFWCIDSVFRRVKGVKSSVCGYTAGQTAEPTYEDICRGDSGHAEVVKIEFDSDVVSYETLLKILFTIHDPTTQNRQGNDTGTQYRSIILYSDDEQKQATETFIASITAKFNGPIVTEVEPLQTFHEAEAYHQDYFTNNPGNGYCQAVIP